MRSRTVDYRVDPYGRSNRDRGGYSPPGRDLSPPPQKRVRTEWSGHDRRYPSSYSSEGYRSSAPANGAGYSSYGDGDTPTQPPIMTFKAFLASQDDMITDEEAIKKYTEYKLEFKRQQLNDFFMAHKEEEWFKSKYHPDLSTKRKEEHLAHIKRRVELFMAMLEQVEKVVLDGDNASSILRLLDSVVIRLENGSDHDLEALDMSDDEDGAVGDKAEQKPFILDSGKKTRPEKTDKIEDLAQMEMTEEQKQLQQKAKEFLKKKEASERKKAAGDDDSGSSSSSSSSSSDSDDDDDGSGSSSDSSTASGDRKANKKKHRSRQRAGSKGTEHSQPAPPGAEQNGSASTTVNTEKQEEPTEPKESEAEPKEAPTDEPPKVESEVVAKPKPRPLHKTCSIFLRNLAPTITKQEVEAMCRRYPGFLRVAIADPQSERRWFRRGWVTFERQVNIKEICWNLNNIRLRDCELGAIVNRDLSRRVRTVNGITSHRPVVRADIRLAARIIHNLDERHRLWMAAGSSAEEGATGEGGSGDQQLSYGFNSPNPILRNITDYLIEEASAEEDELLGVVSADASKESPAQASAADSSADGNTADTAVAGDTIERDETLIKVLDKLLLYLRIVHSVDFYNHSEYPNEDEMPNRCGLIHTRGIPPSSKVSMTETEDYIKSFENKIGSFLQPLPLLSKEECKESGLILKDSEEETEKFVQANTQELSKDKWLCPLSNKKFKGPDFVRKHIINKHSEKIDEVKKEVEFFNNYIFDPKRPQLPDHPSTRSVGGSSSSGRKEETPAQFHVGPYPQSHPMPHHSYGGSYGSGYQRSPMYPGYQSSQHPSHASRDPYYREPYLPPRDAYPRPPRPYGRRFNRPLNSYRDLDAPKEVDEF